ncbi:MAG: tetratricopeptide repeat protein [Thermoanaerobaculia bacterium]
MKELQDPAQRLSLAQARLGGTAKAIALQDVIALGLDEVPEEVQKAFYALGAFAPKPASFSLQAAEVVTLTDEEPLEWLVQRNLLDVVSLPDIVEAQLTLHQVLADAARARMPASAQLLHGAYYLDLVNEDRQDWRKIDTAYAQIRWAWDHWPDDIILPWVWVLHEHQYTRGLWRDLLAWNQRALPIVRADGQKKQEARVLNTLGWAQAALGQREKALTNLELALRIREEEGDRAGVATTLTDIGLVYQQLRCLDKALEYYQRALPISEEISDLSGMSRVLNNIGTIYMALNQPGEALNYLPRALSIREELNWQLGVATTLSNIGGAYMALGRRDEAIDCCHRALTITEELGYRAGEIGVRRLLARLHYDEGNLSAAVTILRRAYDLASAINSPDLAEVESVLAQYKSELAAEES